MKKLIALLILITGFCSAQTQNITHTFNFYTEYHQFYLEDKEAKGDTGSPNFWTDEAFEARFATEQGIIAVGTYCYGNVKGEITVLQNPVKDIDYSLYDHVVEGGIDISSGELLIMDCPTSTVELTIKVTPGKYRVRVYGSNFKSVAETDLANESDNDYYKIEIWPDDDMERKVLKQFVEDFDTVTIVGGTETTSVQGSSKSTLVKIDSYDIIEEVNENYTNDIYYEKGMEAFAEVDNGIFFYYTDFDGACNAIVSFDGEKTVAYKNGIEVPVKTMLWFTLGTSYKISEQGYFLHANYEEEGLTFTLLLIKKEGKIYTSYSSLGYPNFINDDYKLYGLRDCFNSVLTIYDAD
ncbi:hypothetical protein [Flavobacterium beibuense]|uniref:hypothetical protein n=1 Tax=Flavobacterium beibuense TaxID=657326 RepID=UPI003A92B060